MQIPKKYKKVREINIKPQELIDFETRVKEKYEKGEISGPIHLSKNNEKELIDKFLFIIYCWWYHTISFRSCVSFKNTKI